MNIRIFPLIALSIGIFTITGCATPTPPPPPPGPPTGWETSLYPESSLGVYIFADGSRWHGGNNNGQIDGWGTHFFGSEGGPNTSVPEGYIDASFTRYAKDSQWIAGPIIVVVPNGHLDLALGFTFKGMTDGVGLVGPGQLIRNDGFKLEGNFNYGEMPIARIADNGNGLIWENYKMIASYAYGSVKASWPNGSTFEGEIVDFYPFNRGSYDVSCLPSYLYGNGLLRRPGKNDYIGLVRESWEAEPTSKEDFLEHIQKFGDCPRDALAVQNEINNRQAEYDAEMEAGRRRADKVLAADLSSLSRKIANDMARVESASRGSSVEMDQENERKNALLYEVLVNSKSDERSTLNLNSETKSEKATQPSEAITPPDTSKPLQSTEMAKYPFRSSVTYASTYANLTREKALETVSSERANQEPMYMANAVSWRAVSVSSPDCSIREDIRETGHWVCKITVEYEGESRLNQNATPSTGGNVQSR